MFADILHHWLDVREGPRGRGVFSLTRTPRGICILRDHVIEVGFDDIVERSVLNAYPMAWTETHNAIAFGLTNLINHSDTPNCTILRFPKERVICVTALQRISVDEELTIRYACDLWFTPT